MPPSTTGRYTDPTGDTGSDVHPWVDIREIQFATSDVRLTLVANPPPAVDPAQRWIAYGVVVDDDRDGIPDWRLGMDNLPLAVGDGQNHRAWRTDLHTGRTTAHDPAYCCITGVVLDSSIRARNRTRASSSAARRRLDVRQAWIRMRPSMRGRR